VVVGAVDVVYSDAQGRPTPFKSTSLVVAVGTQTLTQGLLAEGTVGAR